MKSYNTVYYLLTVLLIMGSFASMAQNDYGMLILTGVSIAFGLIFLIQFFRSVQRKDVSLRNSAFEFFVLFFMTVVLAIKTFQVHILYMELAFGIAAILLALIYFRKMLAHMREYSSRKKTLARLLMIAYLSVVFFCLAAAVITFIPALGSGLAITAMLLLVVFIFLAFSHGDFMVEGVSLSAFSVIAQFRDRFYLLLSLFVLFALYTGFTNAGVLPRLYSDKFPQTYYQLVGEAESGREKTVDGLYKYQVFKSGYDQFVEKNLSAGGH